MAKGVKEYSETSHDELTVQEIVGRVSRYKPVSVLNRNTNVE